MNSPTLRKISSAPSILDKVILDTDLIASFFLFKQFSLSENLYTLSRSVSSPSSYVLSANNTDSYISTMPFNSSIKSDISTLSNNLKNLLKAIGKINCRINHRVVEIDLTIE